MGQENVVRLPNLEERFWSEIEATLRPFLLSQGRSSDAVDAALAKVKERCQGMPLKASVELPEGIDMTREIQLRLDQALSDWMTDLAGFMIARMIDREIEICERQ